MALRSAVPAGGNRIQSLMSGRNPAVAMRLVGDGAKNRGKGTLMEYLRGMLNERAPKRAGVSRLEVWVGKGTDSSRKR